MSHALWLLGYAAVSFGAALILSKNAHRSPIWPWWVPSKWHWLVGLVIAAPWVYLAPALVRRCAGKWRGASGDGTGTGERLAVNDSPRGAP